MRKEDHKKFWKWIKEKSKWAIIEVHIKNNLKPIKNIYKKATNSSATILQRYWSATMKIWQNYFKLPLHFDPITKIFFHCLYKIY